MLDGRASRRALSRYAHRQCRRAQNLRAFSFRALNDNDPEQVSGGVCSLEAYCSPLSLLLGCNAVYRRSPARSDVALLLQFQPGDRVVYDNHALLRSHKRYLVEYYAREEELMWRRGTAGTALPLCRRRVPLIDHVAYMVPPADVPLDCYARLFTKRPFSCFCRRPDSCFWLTKRRGYSSENSSCWPMVRALRVTAPRERSMAMRLTQLRILSANG